MLVLIYFILHFDGNKNFNLFYPFYSDSNVKHGEDKGWKIWGYQNAEATRDVLSQGGFWVIFGRQKKNIPDLSKVLGAMLREFTKSNDAFSKWRLSAPGIAWLAWKLDEDGVAPNGGPAEAGVVQPTHALFPFTFFKIIKFTRWMWQTAINLWRTHVAIALMRSYGIEEFILTIVANWSCFGAQIYWSCWNDEGSKFSIFLVFVFKQRGFAALEVDISTFVLCFSTPFTKIWT